MLIGSILMLFAFTFASFAADDPNNSTNTPVADALDWYLVWFSSSVVNIPGAETCQGELRGSSYSFRCDPLSVVLTAVANDRGHCSITSMRPSISREDGLRVQTLQYLIQPDVAQKKSVAPQDCGELPLREGRFQLVVTPRGRAVNNMLSTTARNAALAYATPLSRLHACLLRFPNVKTGDPFFHVYVECNGVLDTIWQFPIENGQAADSADWYYSPKRGFPKGYEWRLQRKNLWFGMSRPEEQAAAGAR